MREYRKVKYMNDVLLLEWEQNIGQKDEERTIRKSEDQPHPDWFAALNALKEDVAAILDAPFNWLEPGKILGLSLKREDNGARGVVFTFQLPLNSCAAPMTFNTPYLREFVESEEAPEGGYFASEEMMERVEALLEQCERFIAGKRSQMDMLAAEGQ